MVSLQLVDSSINYKGQLNQIDHLIDHNALLCDRIASFAIDFYGIKADELEELVDNNESVDRTSVSQALKHYVRDWAEEGVDEREAAFPCLLGTLNTLFLNRPTTNASAPSIKALLPGSGLGRLGHELADLGGMFPYRS